MNEKFGIRELAPAIFASKLADSIIGVSNDDFD